MKNNRLKSIAKLILFIFILTSKVTAQSNKTFFLGHSLINFHIPNMVDKLSIAGEQMFTYDANIGVGASLQWHFTNPTTGQGDQWDLTLPQGGYENFIITEAVPLQNHLQYRDTHRIVDSLYRFDQENNANIQYYIYETWHCINSGNGSTTDSGGYPCRYDSDSNTPWRERIDIDLPKWESIADSINLTHTNPMFVIPGGQALAKLDDTLQIGTVSGLSSIFDLFDDEYHLDAIGNYFIACVMHSVIHGKSSVGLPNQLTTQYDNLYTVYPSPAQAEIMQEIAWKTVCDYQRTGVDSESVALYPTIKEKPIINVYPVPANEHLSIEFDTYTKAEPFTISDQLGRTILGGTLNSKITIINVDDLSDGLYYLTTKNQVIKFIK